MFIFLYERAGCNHPAANGVTSFSFTNCSLCFIGNARQPQTRHCSSSFCLKVLFNVTLRGKKISHKGKDLPRVIISFPGLQHLCSVAAHSTGRHGEIKRTGGKRCREKLQGWNSPELKSTARENKAMFFLSPLDKNQQPSGRKIEVPL